MSTIIRSLLTTSAAPKPVAPYTQAVIADRTVYVSGCLGLDKDTGKMVAGGAAAEAKQALVNLKNVLTAAGSSIENVVKATVFVTDLNEFSTVNEEYKKVFDKDYPARTCVQVSKLPMGGLVEIEAVAITGDVRTIHLKN